MERPRLSRNAVLALVALALLGGGVVVSALSGGDGGDPDPLKKGLQASGTPDPGSAPEAAPEPSEEEEEKAAAPRFPYRASVRRQARRMPLTRQVAQLFAIGFDGYFPRAPFFERLKRRAWGVVVLERRNFTDESQISTLAGEVGAIASVNELPVPIVAAAQPGGPASAFPDLPPAAPPSIGESGSRASRVRRAREEAVSAAERLRGLNIDMTLAPVADIAGAASPSAATSFGEDPGEVGAMVAGAVRGYRDAALIPAVGHFPGQGSASQDPQLGPATVGLSLDELRKRDMAPFVAAVRARTPVVIVSNALYTAFDGITPATLLPKAVGELRGLGFDGVVMTDDLVGTQAASGAATGPVAVSALRAGADLLYLSGSAADQEKAYRAVLAAVEDGTIPRRRILGSVLRLLDLKRRFKVGQGL